MRPSALLLILGTTPAYSAIDLDGSQVSTPLDEGDPSPVGDPLIYIPDQHDCPLPCVDYSNVHKWTPFFSVDRLRRCEQPMLLQFSVSHPLDDPTTDVLIRSCTLGADPAEGDRTIINATSVEFGNPKTADGLVEISLDVAPACAIEGQEREGELSLSRSSGFGQASGSDVAGLLHYMEEFFNVKDNCDETLLFAYSKETVAGVYIGAGLGKRTIASSLEAVAQGLQNTASVANRTLAQLCDIGSKAENIFGISIDTTGNILAVQRAALDWVQGKCAIDGILDGPEDTIPVKIFDIAGASFSDDVALALNGTSHSGPSSRSNLRHITRNAGVMKRSTCSYIQVQAGDGCTSLAAKCGIRGADFTKYNSKTNLCSTLQEGDYVCCSAGDPYVPSKPDAPVQNADGTCSSYLIQNGDTCSSLSEKYGLTVDDIESFNKGKTWAWTECGKMLLGYNMCLSEGAPPLPPPQQGAECGPLVPGTQQPTDSTINMADLNPCPLKACCSNWGFCGPFAAHCEIHAPKDGGPGSKLESYSSSCVSNCGNEIKQNSGPPTAFNRIGYYESWNLGRDCLWLNASNANTDGTYTHMHWGFAEIDPDTWKPVITDPHGQWEGFKKLENIKKIVSFGGWAYSTEPATYNIIRSAIISNRETFAANIAQFLTDEGLDGVDIDWEYPGAPDILVDGQPIGQTSDGVAYLRFLTSLKSKVGSRSVSIAAPASYWYLKAFPIDRIAAVIDYIVYMTYDLHGQWDFGNPNAFDSCPSGACIRSHVNLTETRNALSIITKAGVPNNKIFVGESSYGRSFHMAVDGCWGPSCEFTGSRTQSDASPGRCTKTGGYISNAEINELLGNGNGGRQFHDGESNSDIFLYKGDYISYMTPITKNTRREDWKALNFAGSIDWAVDLQAFGIEDMNVVPDRPPTGEEGCIYGEDNGTDSGDLCEFSCHYGFCPESLCSCLATGPVDKLPTQVANGDFIAWKDLDVDLNRLCKFACQYGFCPPDTCGTPIIDEDEDGMVELDSGTENWVDYESIKLGNTQSCNLFKYSRPSDALQCKPYCSVAVKEAEAAGRTTNYGCIGHFPLDQPLPWSYIPGTSEIYVPGKCSCDNWLVNELAETVVEAMPIIAQVGCYVVMSSLKTVLDVGLQFIPGVGKILDAGLDMVTTAAQMAAYLYPEEEDPEGAFSWWLSPCGGTDLVPDDIKEAFNILSTITDGVSSFKKPKTVTKGSGKKGDDANPRAPANPKAGTGSGPNGKGNGTTKKKKCKIPKGQSTYRLGPAKNTLREQSCVADQTEKNEMIITSIVHGSRPTQIAKECERNWSQACFHYSSVISNNPSWSTLTCPHGSSKWERPRPAVATWYAQHKGTGWTDKANLPYVIANPLLTCQADEFPPAYLLGDNDQAFKESGITDKGQLIRYLPGKENGDAGQSWKAVCFAPPVKDMSDADFRSKVNAATGNNRVVVNAPAGSGNKNKAQQGKVTQTFAQVDVDVKPEFTFNRWGHSGSPPVGDGLAVNSCIPKKLTTDPGFALLAVDPYLKNNPNHWDYTKKYESGKNGL